MLEFIRQSRRMSTSRPSSLRSSIDDGPSKASSVGDPGKLTSSTTRHPYKSINPTSFETSHAGPNGFPPKATLSVHATPYSSPPPATPIPHKSTHARPSSSRFTQASSGISKPSPSFVAAHGEFNAPGNTTKSDGDHGCVAQVGIEDGLRGSKNPDGLSLDRSTGYFPKGSGNLHGNRRQSDTTLLNDRPSLEDLLRMIAAERLHHMPQKGSNWDRVIRALETFALRVSGYTTRYTSVVGNAQLKATMIYRECYTLLQLGRNHATSIIPGLGMLAGVSHTLSLFTSCPPQPTSSHFQQYLGQIFDRILDLLNCLIAYFQDVSAGSKNVAAPSCRIRRSLNVSLEAFNLQAGQLLNEIGTFHVPSDIQEPVQFKQVQLLLRPQDEVVRTTQNLLLAERDSRHEFTCEWFSKPFLDFVKSADGAFWIGGRTGCGKSVLCGWIIESLQGPVDGREYVIVDYAVDPRLPSETNTICVIRALLRQIVECQYRSGRLYRALANLVDLLSTNDSPVQVENALWECLEVAIRETEQPTMIVIDGLSELDGGEAAAAALFQKLLHFTADNRVVRLLILSRPFTFSPKTHVRRRTIEARDVHKDMCKVITDLVPSHSPAPRADITRRIEHEADGNFFWSLLALQEWAAQRFSQQVWRTLPLSLEANVVSRLDFSEPNTCLVLFNSIIAIRPLRLVELQVISRLDVNNGLLKPHDPDISRVVENACGPVLVVQDGVVLFRHALLKEALLDLLQSGNLLLGPEMHADMVCRLLLYLKLALGEHSELTLDPTPPFALEDLFHVNPLLSYALRYWPNHMTASSMFPEPESFKPSGDCLVVYPDTVQAANLEGSFWARDLSIESIKALQTAASIRREILGNHEATLQTIAWLAELLRCRKDFSGAANNFYMASEMAQETLPEFHPFTATCMLKFLDVINVANESEVPNMPTRKTSILRYMIALYDTQIGPSSDQSMEARNLLATHYTTMQEYALSTDVHQTLHKLTIARHGKDSNEAKKSAERFVTALQYRSGEESGPYSDSIYDDLLQIYDVTDPRRIKASITKAEAYRSIEDPFNAELVYVNLWHAVSEAFHRQRDIENHEKLLQCGISYSNFLREYGRISDSQSVLLGLWSQQQALRFQTSTISVLLREVATAMESAGLQDLALDVLHALLSSPGTQDLDAIRKSVSDITLDLVHNAQSNTSNEMALQSLLEVKKSQGLLPNDAPLVNALIKRFFDCGRFDDAVDVATQVLYRLWPSILVNPFSLDLADLAQFSSELAPIATNLACAYSRTNQIEGVGSIYWHLYHGARHTDAFDDSTVDEYANRALTAFDGMGQVHQMISLREGLLDVCVVKLGARHSRTIEARYTLASLYSREQLLEKAKNQYLQICDTLKQPTFHDLAALPALRSCIEILSQEKRWDEARDIQIDLWKTFLAKGLEYGFNPDTSKALYTGYATLLKKQDPVGIGQMCEVAEQYRSACTAFWGDRHPTTMEAVLNLADIELSLHPNSSKATQLYESLVDGEEGIPSDGRDDIKATIEAAENRLTDLYQANINKTIENPSHLQGEAVPRAVRLIGKRYEREKTNRGVSQPETLSILTTLVSLLSEDSRSLAIQELQSTIVSLMESDVPPSSLYNAAIILANSYSANGLVEEGSNTARALTEHIIFDEGHDMTRHATRSNLAFLAAFEAHLTGSMVDFAGVYATLLKESALWDLYRRANATGTDPEFTLASGARLRKFLLEHNRLDRASWIEREMYSRFLDDYGAAFAQGIQTTQEFFSVLLEELNSEQIQSETPDIPGAASAALHDHAGSLLDQGEYMAALNLLLPGLEFLRFVGAFANSNNSTLENVLRLGLMLAVPVEDQNIRDKMVSLSKTILQETFRQCRLQNFDFNIIPIERVSRIASVLGLHENYEDLEWLLSRLWLSRKSLTLVSQDVVIRIGRRLVEVRFFHGHVESAIELGEDILYNVQRVYGTSHPTTFDIASLLSTMYAVSGDQAAAKTVIGDVSQLKRPDVKGRTANKPNREYLLQLRKRSDDTDVVPTVLQAPKDWGFIDADDEKGSGDSEGVRYLGR